MNYTAVKSNILAARRARAQFAKVFCTTIACAVAWPMAWSYIF